MLTFLSFYYIIYVTFLMVYIICRNEFSKECDEQDGFSAEKKERE